LYVDYQKTYPDHFPIIENIFKMSPTHTELFIASHKTDFLQTCIDASILKFGSFTLKSGRVSPYFFNVGDFHESYLCNALSTAYAKTLITHTPQLSFDVLFGPAYKGCGLSYGVAMKLGELCPERFRRVGFCHDRKEKKDHGEGGMLVGAPLKGKKVVIIDDVITAGMAKRDAIELIKKEGGEVIGIIVALDRMEKLPKGTGGSEEDWEGDRGSAIGQLRREYGIDVLSVLTLDDLVGGLKSSGRGKEAELCEEYRSIYKSTD